MYHKLYLIEIALFTQKEGVFGYEETLGTMLVDAFGYGEALRTALKSWEKLHPGFLAQFPLCKRASASLALEVLAETPTFEIAA
jgi:hypothetical protein